jgi:hypothetical protein
MSTEHPDATLVREFLAAAMIPDPVKAETYIAPDIDITFTGGRKFTHPRQMAAFNAERYQWVKKDFGPFHVCPFDDETVIYNRGTLYGAWPDGTEFKGNRYIDRFVVRQGKIVKIDVWNDSAEILLER